MQLKLNSTVADGDSFENMPRQGAIFFSHILLPTKMGPTQQIVAFPCWALNGDGCWLNQSQWALHKILATSIQQCIKRHICAPSGIYSKYSRLIQYLKSINAAHRIKKLKKKILSSYRLAKKKQLIKITYPWPGAVAHTCNLSTLGGRGERIN